MEQTIEKKPKRKLALWLDPNLVRRLFRERADQDRPISIIVEEHLWQRLGKTEEDR